MLPWLHSPRTNTSRTTPSPLHQLVLLSIDASDGRTSAPLTVLAPHLLLLALGLLQLAATSLAWRWYTRHRVAAQAAMRMTRTGGHLYWTVLSQNSISWWRRRMASERSDPRRTLAVSLLAVPLAYLQKHMMHPVPTVLLPPFLALDVIIFLSGWLGVVGAAWSEPMIADVTARLCGDVRFVLLLVDLSATTLLGCVCMPPRAANGRGAHGSCRW
jgi:hypothetical protein